MGRVIFLASLGACYRLVECSRELLADYSTKQAELFDELIKRGEQVQQDAEARFHEQLDLGKRMNLEGHMERLRCNLNALKEAFGMSTRTGPKA